MILNQAENEGGSLAGKKIMFVICIYFVLTVITRYSQHQGHRGPGVIQKIQNGSVQVRLEDLLSEYQIEEIYVGTWRKVSPHMGANHNINLTEGKGHFQFKINKFTPYSKHPRYRMEIMVINGDYIDHGTLTIEIILGEGEFMYERVENRSVEVRPLNFSEIDSSFYYQKMFLTQHEGPLLLTDLSFRFAMGEGAVASSVLLTIFDFTLELEVNERENRLIKLTIFAIVIFIVSYTPFIAIMTIIRRVYDGRENPLNFSLITITIATMWDAIICMVSFKMAFDDQSLVLFILPAFILCLLFTNLEPRLMLAIYERNLPPGQRTTCFNYNCLSYGSLILIYPILILTNFNRLFFLAASCILFPQIYRNGTTGHRPDISSSYYVKFILSRYLIIFYLKCFPYNVFRMEPDYTLGLICLVLIIIQLGLLNIQNKYGPKMVIPKCMLEPVYDYSYEEAVNLGTGNEENQCSICLTSLNSDPPNPTETEGDRSIRLMKTPCKHTYHASCLVSWMKIKLACPQCRTVLPPFE